MASHDDDFPGIPDSRNYASETVVGFWIEWPVGHDRHVASINNAAAGLDVREAVVGEDDEPDYIALIIPPSDIRFSEPHATAVTNMQDGGIVVEKRGVLQRPITISGTTGFVPIRDSSPNAPFTRPQRSGYKALYQLRRLFNRFGSAAKTTIGTKLHYMDFKANDFWYVEVESFDVDQTSKRPLMYAYTIRLIALKPSDVRPPPLPNPTAAQMVLSSGDADIADLADYAAIFGGQAGISQDSAFDSIVGGLGTSLQALATVNRFEQIALDWQIGYDYLPPEVRIPLTQFFQNVDVLTQLFDPLTFFNSTTSDPVASSPVSLGVVRAAYDSAYVAWQAASDFAPSGVREEANEMFVEVTNLLAHLAWDARGRGNSYADNVAADVDSFNTPLALGGSSTDVVPSGGQALASNPFFPAGLGVTTNVQDLTSSPSFKLVAINRGETIRDVAYRCLGSPHRFVDLVFVNELSPPFVVSDDVRARPSGVLAWGDLIKIPVQDAAGASGQGPPLSAPSTFAGVVTRGGTAFQVVVEGKDFPWRTDQWAGFTVTMMSGGSLVDPTRVVTANDGDVLSIDRAWSVLPDAGDTFQVVLTEFRLRGEPTPDELAYGRDVYVNFPKKAGVYNPYRGTAVWDAADDLATVAGLANYEQAMVLLMGTERGANQWHPSYGGALPIGRPLGGKRVMLYAYQVRRAILRDPRTDSVDGVRFVAVGGATNLTARISPIRARRSFQFGAAVSR